ncbi:MAG: hypothetical protein U1A27_06275 [Phycisphaerae bacterium]
MAGMLMRAAGLLVLAFGGPFLLGQIAETTAKLITGDWPSYWEADLYYLVAHALQTAAGLYLLFGGRPVRRLLERALADGGCRECGYDLTGNASGRCPECGVPARRMLSN